MNENLYYESESNQTSESFELSVKVGFRSVQGTLVIGKTFPRQNSDSCYVIIINSFIYQNSLMCKDMVI